MDSCVIVSTHSRLKAAGGTKINQRLDMLVSTHSRLKAAGKAFFAGLWDGLLFQHTAA